MDTKQFLAFQLEDAEYQLSKCFEGISEAALNTQTTESAMTPLETCSHLGEAYQALLSTLAGEKHEWGTFKLEDPSWPKAWETVLEMRKRAVAGVLAQEGEEAPKMAHMYVLAHDYYHVGQICLARIKAEPEFDAYSIYRM